MGGCAFGCVGVVEGGFSLVVMHMLDCVRERCVRVDKNLIRGSLYQLGHSLDMLLRLHSRL